MKDLKKYFLIFLVVLIDYNLAFASQDKSKIEACDKLSIAKLTSHKQIVATFGKPLAVRSEERRVGKECRSRWSPYH